MNIRNRVFATAAIALITALFNVSAFAIASSSDQSARPQDEATNQAAYPSNAGMGSSDRSAAPSGSIGAPGESSEQSSQTYGPTDQSESNDGSAAPDSASSQDAAPDSTSDQESSDQETGSADHDSGRATTTPSSESAQVALPPTERPAILSAPEEPRYTPETGDAEYGSKINPERSAAAAVVEPPARFNDATGQ